MRDKPLRLELVVHMVRCLLEKPVRRSLPLSSLFSLTLQPQGSWDTDIAKLGKVKSDSYRVVVDNLYFPVVVVVAVVAVLVLVFVPVFVGFFFAVFCLLVLIFLLVVLDHRCVVVIMP